MEAATCFAHNSNRTMWKASVLKEAEDLVPSVESDFKRKFAEKTEEDYESDFSDDDDTHDAPLTEIEKVFAKLGF